LEAGVIIKPQLECTGLKYMTQKTKKATFNLHYDVIVALDQAMAEGAASSKNVLVERALVKELKELRRQARQSMWEKGAKDPALLKDISDTEAAFKSADAETAGRIS
jgi:hypothetical protein